MLLPSSDPRLIKVTEALRRETQRIAAVVREGLHVGLQMLSGRLFLTDS